MERRSFSCLVQVARPFTLRGSVLYCCQSIKKCKLYCQNIGGGGKLCKNICFVISLLAVFFTCIYCISVYPKSVVTRSTVLTSTVSTNAVPTNAVPTSTVPTSTVPTSSYGEPGTYTFCGYILQLLLLAIGTCTSSWVTILFHMYVHVHVL